MQTCDNQWKVETSLLTICFFVCLVFISSPFESSTSATCLSPFAIIMPHQAYSGAYAYSKLPQSIKCAWAVPIDSFSAVFCASEPFKVNSRVKAKNEMVIGLVAVNLFRNFTFDSYTAYDMINGWQVSTHPNDFCFVVVLRHAFRQFYWSLDLNHVFDFSCQLSTNWCLVWLLTSMRLDKHRSFNRRCFHILISLTRKSLCMFIQFSRFHFVV